MTTTPGFNGTVATITDQNSPAPASDFTATIDWGDGSTSSGTVTGSSGTYTIDGSHTYAAEGPFTVTVHVADDGGSTDDATTYLLVYQYTNSTDSSFVIGNGDATGEVYFWGAQWAQHNLLGTGTAPAAFKGFASGSAQSCGQTFTTQPGDSSAPPDSVPAYVAVAVTDSVAKSGPTITGTIQKMVVVKTNDGYRSDPGAPGTGEVVATICG